MSALVAFAVALMMASAQRLPATLPDPDYRSAYLDVWEALRADPTLSGAERFACLVQQVVDETYARVSDPASPYHGADGRQLLLDDLVDLFVPNDYRREKTLVMTTPSVLPRAIGDSAEDRASFRPELQAGDGRYRHFAMNAAAGYRLPGPLVDWLARSVGNDFEPEADASGDSAADLEANAIGRAFAVFLRAHELAELADGESVKVWLLEQFTGRP